MEDIVAVAAAISDLGGILYGGRPLRCRRANALVSQLAEETDSKPVQCEFESHRGHPAHPNRSGWQASHHICADLLRTTYVIRSRYPSFYAAMKGSETSDTLRLPP